ncbi:MAG TPA: hypothetical protein VHL57_03590 [Flavobacteriales bacterium]|jgi:hypothetical protein|nr:hypothetical protein [Flavobacteriales bacterium]
MLVHLLLHLVRVLQHGGSNGDEYAHDQRVARLATRRRIAHADVPAMETIEAQYGPRLDELTTMLFATDPANMHTRKSRSGRDTEHLRAMRQRYRLIAWTLLYRLLPERAVDQLPEILNKELMLWREVQLRERDLNDPAGIVAQIRYWGSRWEFH